MSTLETVVEDLRERFEAPDPARHPSWTEENPIGLEQTAAVNIARELNRHQSALFILFHQYQKHHWLVEGPQFRDLHVYFEESYNEVHKDLDAIAERVTVLGAIPTSSPMELSKQSYLIHEPEGYFPLRSMVEHDLKMERLFCTMVRNTIARALDCQDFGTSTLLKQVLLRAEDRAHHLDHYLAEDGLTQ